MNNLYKIKTFIDKIVGHITSKLFITILEYSISIVMIIGYYAIAVPMMFMVGGFYSCVGIALYCIPIILVMIGWTICEIVKCQEMKTMEN